MRYTSTSDAPVEEPDTSTGPADTDDGASATSPDASDPVDPGPPGEPAVAAGDPEWVAGATERPRSGSVFRWSAALVLTFLAATLFFPSQAEATLSFLQTRVIATFGWYYTLLVVGLVVFCLIVAFGPSGRITLGRRGEKPEFSLPAWFSMVFACGMGIGLVFWGPAEPLTHFVQPRPGVEGEPEELATAAMTQTFLHWGPQAWAIYAAVGLALAYAIHRRGKPLSVRWTLEPWLGDRVKGRWGDVVDIVTVLGTVFGVATTLGFEPCRSPRGSTTPASCRPRPPSR
ncbi:BCCT family transporter [Litorihabitans aurantiacus]|uniref:BCCT, betaine/carnitine/choline family transporter n=1 Tax=Litorihabitans aurantiacus TaxID=1930061 RepID=A0AA38CU80_9MICO|nr:hypothetical protein GCM10025875_19370 [Litorihabitans aurantiacus]